MFQLIKVNAEVSAGRMTISVEGHADYAEHGKDIVCAAVSTVMQTALLGLEAIAEQYPGHVQVEVKTKEEEHDENQMLEA